MDARPPPSFLFPPGPQSEERDVKVVLSMYDAVTDDGPPQPVVAAHGGRASLVMRMGVAGVDRAWKTVSTLLSAQGSS